jgi:Tol biopolymer transport system component
MSTRTVLYRLAVAGLPFMSGCALLQSSNPRACVRAESERFAPGVISGSEKDAFGAFSPDGNEFYFTRFSIGRDRSTILLSRKVDGEWTAPKILPFSGQHGDREPFMSPDGRWLFFTSDRPDPEKRDPSYDLWMIERLGPEGWGTPRRLPAPINGETSEGSPVVTKRGTLYFASGRPGGYGAMDLYRAHRGQGQYGTVRNLGPAVNTKDSEQGVYLTPDERVMLITRTFRGRGGRPAPDLYLSLRQRGGWSHPRLLKAPVNSEAHEFGPTLSPDGRGLYFTRDVTQNFIRDLDASMDVHRVPACVMNDERAVRRTLERMRRSHGLR